MKKCDVCGITDSENNYYDINGYMVDDVEANAQNPDALAHYLCDSCYEEHYDDIFGGDNMNNIKFIGAMGAKHADSEEKLMAIVNSIVDVTAELADDGDEITRLEHTRNRLLEFGIEWEWEKYGSLWCNTPVIAEEKKDGFSYLGTYGGQVVSKSLSTAKETKGQPVIKSSHIPKIAKFVKHIWDVYGADVHMEIYKPGGNSDSVTSIMGCTAEKAISRQLESGNLIAMVHDIRTWKGIDITSEPWYIRRAILQYLMQNISNTSCELVDKSVIELSQVRTHNVVEWFNEIVENGGEGIMLKYTNAKYVPDKKPANTWVKWKKEITLDVVIMGTNDNGTGKNADLFGSMKIGIWDENKQKVVEIGQCNSGISDNLRREIAENTSDYINRVIEVDAMELTKNNSLRHPRLVRFRDDKIPQQCTTDGLRIKYYE